jgi:glycosyltransferase involved in cell wall biosynthesis
MSIFRAPGQEPFFASVRTSEASLAGELVHSGTAFSLESGYDSLHTLSIQPFSTEYPQAPVNASSSSWWTSTVSGVEIAYSQQYRDSDSVSAQPKPLRVLHVGPSFVCAGVETWLQTLHRESHPHRLKIIHQTITDERCADRSLLSAAGIPWSIGLGQPFERACADADVLLTWGPCGLADRLPKQRPPVTVFVAHGVSPWTVESFVSNRRVIDHVVAVSGKAAQVISPDVACSVILNGVNPVHLLSSVSPAESRESMGFAADDFVVGFVGRLSPEKQVSCIIEALADCDRRVKFLCVGWGPLRAELMDRCNQLLPGRYVFREARRDLGNYYQAMDAFCFPSREEGFGLALAEAMYCGVPAIATNVGAVPELMQHQIQGVVVDGSAASIRGAIESLQQHPDWRRGLASEGRASVMRHALGHQMARQYEQLLWRLWRQKTSGR